MVLAMSEQQPQFWPKFRTDRFRFAPVFKGPSWLAVLKVHDLDAGLAQSERAALLELGFMQGSQGRFIYPHYPDEKLVDAVAKALNGSVEVMTADQVVVLHDGVTLKQPLPAEMVEAVAWFYSNKPVLLGSEIRRSLTQDSSEEAQELLNTLEQDRFLNPDRLRGWVSIALEGEISPVSEPILGLAAAKAAGVYEGEPPEEIREWIEALAEYRGEDPIQSGAVSEAEALRSRQPEPKIGELVHWGDATARESGRVVSISEDYPGSAWIAPSAPGAIGGLLIPSKVRVSIDQLEGYSTSDAQISAPANKAESSGPLKRGTLSLDDVASESIRSLEDRGLINDRVKRLIRGVYKAGLLRGRTPLMGEKSLEVKDMVSHWHFVRSDLDAELGGETPQVLDAAAYVRDQMIEEFNNAQPELPGGASEIFAVIPVETTKIVASEELETDLIQSKLDRETVYGIGLHPRFAVSLDRDALADRIESLNDTRMLRALQDSLKSLYQAPLSFSNLIPQGTLPTRLIQEYVWNSYDPEETTNADLEEMVREHSDGRLFFTAKSAGEHLVSNLKEMDNSKIAKRNEHVIQSVAQLSGESHRTIESLPHPLFLLVDEIKKAGVLSRASKAQVLAALNIDMSKSLGLMGDLGALAGLSLQVVNNDAIREETGNGRPQVPRSELAAGILRNNAQGARPFSLAITATDEKLTELPTMTGSEHRTPLLRPDDVDPHNVRAMSIGNLVNLNFISPLLFGDGLGESMVLTDEALADIEPNYFELPNFKEMYLRRSMRHALDNSVLSRVTDMPALDANIPTEVSEISNRLGTAEKGLQSVLGSWRSDDQARERLLDGIQHWLGNHKHFKTVPFLPRVAEDVLDKLEVSPDCELVVLVSKRSARRVRWQAAPVTTHALENSQYSREEAAEMTALKFKNSHSQYANFHTEVFDPMSILKPEARKYLSDQKLKAEKESQQKDSPKAKKETVKRGERQNQGLVAGLSMKDLRGKTDTVLNHLSASNEIDQAKLCKKTKLWEAPDWTALRSGESEGGAMEPVVADFFSQIRKGLPAGSPVNVKKINLLYAKTILKVRDAFNETRTVDQLKDIIENSLGQAFKDLEDEASELGVSADLILGRHRGYIRPSDYLNYMMRKSERRTQNNEQWPNELIQTKAAFRTGKDDTGAMPTLTRLNRKGAPDYRNGQDADEETLISTFGFSGVEYGESMPQAERTTYLNHAFDGFRDLATALEVNPKSLSLSGTLGLAFGSRGRGGRRAALAHFEPANNVINLTRMKGAGSMAHEVGHALANYFSRMVSGQSRGPGDLAESVSAGGQFKALEKETLGGLRKEIYDAFSVIMANTRYKFADEKTAFDLSNMGKEWTPGSDMRQGAQFADNGKKKPYWATPAEMFARSFETWVHEKLKSIDSSFQNDFLVRPDKLTAWGKTIKEQRDEGVQSTRAQLYPSGDQLAVLSKAFQSLVQNMKEGVKRVDHEHLGEIDMPYLYSRDTGSIQKLQKEDMGPMAQCVIAEISRMCGSEVEVQFKKELKDDHNNDVAGRFASIEGEHYHPGKGIRGIVEIAYGAPMSVAWHEAFHYAQGFLLSEEEQQSLDISFEPGSELHGRLTDSLAREGKADLIDFCDDPKEAQAYAYQQWVTGSLDLKVEERPKTLFGEIKSFFGKVFGVSKSSGFTSPEHLFQSFYDGRLAARSNLQQTLSDFSQERYQTLELEANDPQDARDLEAEAYSVAMHPS
jgi:hypothetical protein